MSQLFTYTDSYYCVHTSRGASGTLLYDSTVPYPMQLEDAVIVAEIEKLNPENSYVAIIRKMLDNYSIEWELEQSESRISDDGIYSHTPPLRTVPVERWLSGEGYYVRIWKRQNGQWIEQETKVPDKYKAVI